MGFDKNTNYIRCSTCQQPQHAECLKLWFQTPIGRVQVGKDPRCQAADGFKNRLEFIAGSTNTGRPLGLPPYPVYSKNRSDPDRPVFTNAELRRQRMLDEAVNGKKNYLGNWQNNIRRYNYTNRAKKGGKKARTRKCRS